MMAVNPTEHLGLAWSRCHYWLRVSPTARILGHDDLLSEAYVGLVKACRGYRSETGATFWGYAKVVIDHCILNFMQRERLHGLTPVRTKDAVVVSPKHEPMHGGNQREAPADDLDGLFAASDVQTILKKLPADERLLLERRYFRQMTLQEIADKDRVTRQAVNVRINAVMARLAAWRL
jgi:RNA polymerase sigma factor (sigma-70 family)